MTRHCGATLALLLCCCSPVPRAQAEARDLLSLAVRELRPEVVDAFNEAIDKATAMGEHWVRDPMTVVRRFSRTAIHQTEAWALRCPGQSPHRCKIVAVFDGFFDDSIRGEYRKVSLVRSRDGPWRLTRAYLAWRCWPGRGHQAYSTVPCS